MQKMSWGNRIVQKTPKLTTTFVYCNIAAGSPNSGLFSITHWLSDWELSSKKLPSLLLQCLHLSNALLCTVCSPPCLSPFFWSPISLSPGSSPSPHFSLLFPGNLCLFQAAWGASPPGIAGWGCAAQVCELGLSKRWATPDCLQSIICQKQNVLFGLSTLWWLPWEKGWELALHYPLRLHSAVTWAPLC